MERRKKLEERLVRYTHEMTRFTFPTLTDSIEEWAPGRGVMHQLHDMSYLEDNWDLLRKKVIGAKGAVKVDGINHLEGMVRILENRLGKLHDRWEQEHKFQLTWGQELRNLKSDVGGDGSTVQEEGEGPTPYQKKKEVEEIVEGSKQRIGALGKMISLVKYRLSMAECMLTQISIIDYIQTWEEFMWHVEQMQAKEELDETHERTLVVGRALIEHQDGPLPEFLTKKEFKEWAAALIYRGPGSVENALRDTGCWATGQSGRDGSGLTETMINCVKYAKLHDEKTKENKTPE